MKTAYSKSGMIITVLLVLFLLVNSFFEQRRAKTISFGASTDQISSPEMKTEINLKRIGRHLLDFYK